MTLTARITALLSLSGTARNESGRAVTPSVSRDSNGSSAPSHRRLPLAILCALALLTSLAFASSASAAPPSTEMGAISEISYTSAQVTGKVTTDGSAPFGGPTAYAFQFSDDEGATWHPGLNGGLGGLLFGPHANETVGGTLTVPKGGTKYLVRLVANNGFFLGAEPEVPSPPPNPSFTTLVADPPVVETTDNATEVTYTTASVSGKVNRPTQSNDLTCNFEYITDAAYLANPVGDRFSGATPVACEPSPVSTVGSSEVKAQLTGLINATTYHLRLAVSNASHADAKEAAAPFTTLTVDPPTVVSIDNATDVFSRSANAAGVIKRSAVEDPAFDIFACRFEYVTAAQFGATGFKDAGIAYCVEPINNGPDEETSVTANLTGLEPETTYHLRLAAENAAAAPGTKEAAATFTTTAKVAKPSVIKVENATGVDQDSAKVSGVVERPAGADPALDVTCRAEYVSEAAFQGNEEQLLRVSAGVGTYTVGFKGASTAPLAFNAPAASVQAALAGLAGIGTGNVSVRGGPGNKAGAAPYLIVFVGALANNNVDEMTTDPSGLPGHEVGFAGATVQTLAEGGHSPGFVDPGRTDCDPLAPGAGPQDATVGIFGLQPDTTYHLRLTAENGGGTDTKDAAATFTTPQNYPASAVLGPITDISYGGATLSGEADSEGIYSTNVYEVSTDGENWIPVGSEGGVVPVKPTPVAPAVVTGLRGATKYFVRLRVVNINDFGGPPLALSPQPHPSFTTLPVDPAVVLKADDATDVTAETAKVSGEIERPANPDPAFDANCRFEYVTDAQFQANGYQSARETPCGIDPLSTPGEKKAVEGELTELRSGTKYHLRLTATNAGPDASLEAVNTFTTIAVPATVTATAGGSDNEGGYVLSGLVNPNNSTITDCKFVYGPTSEADYKKYPFAVPCSPLPDGVNERQRVRVEADSGLFKLSFGDQITGDIPFDAPASVVQVALESLSSIGSGGVSEVTRTGGRAIDRYLVYDITFSGPLAGRNLPPLQDKVATKPLHGLVSVSTVTEGRANTPITVEGHVTGLTHDATYHFRLVATNAFGAAVTPDQEFVPTVAAKEPCPANEHLRTENNSLALPECRAYEMVTPPGKEGFGTSFKTYDGGARVAYASGATNIAKSGQGDPIQNFYVAERTAAGWETIPNLNGSSGSILDAPSNFTTGVVLDAFSPDLLSMVWRGHRAGDPGADGSDAQLRGPDGTFTLIGNVGATGYTYSDSAALAVSADLSHVLTWTGGWPYLSRWGPGVYEYVVGTGMDEPRRVDLDNSGVPISTCIGTNAGNSSNRSVSADGSTIVNYVYGGCGGANPPADELWARLNGTTAIDVSASHCDRVTPACNAPANPVFQAATPDGSRVFFTTTQQLVNADTDQTNDIYACDIPAGNPAPTPDKANHCSALRQVSAGDPTGAAVESFGVTSETGDAVLFTANGKLADNEDAFKEKAVAGDHNLYLWRATDGDPDGQTTFLARLDSDTDLLTDGSQQGPQVTPDGRFFVFTIATQLLDTDTDTARDVYRYDADTGTLTRVSTNVFGVAGNGDGFPAAILAEHGSFLSSPGKVVHPAVSDDGTKIVFTTTEALSPADGNAEPDVYLWTPARVSLISTGSSGFAPKAELTTSAGEFYTPKAAIAPSGEDIYFESAQRLTPADPDSSNDVYDARIGGGFSFAPPPVCSGEKCQSDPTPPSPNPPSPANQPNGEGNVKPPKPCPKGKVRNKKGKCVKKHKKHQKKSHKKAGHDRGGSK